MTATERGVAVDVDHTPSCDSHCRPMYYNSSSGPIEGGRRPKESAIVISQGVRNAATALRRHGLRRFVTGWRCRNAVRIRNALGSRVAGFRPVVAPLRHLREVADERVGELRPFIAFGRVGPEADGLGPDAVADQQLGQLARGDGFAPVVGRPALLIVGG